jgi:hypothetical protein
MGFQRRHASRYVAGTYAGRQTSTRRTSRWGRSLFSGEVKAASGESISTTTLTTKEDQTHSTAAGHNELGQGNLVPGRGRARRYSSRRPPQRRSRPRPTPWTPATEELGYGDWEARAMGECGCLKDSLFRQPPLGVPLGLLDARSFTAPAATDLACALP